MSWAWVTGDLTEHEMEEEHGHGIGEDQGQQKVELKEFEEAADLGGGRVYSLPREKKRQRRFGLSSQLLWHVQGFE